MRCLRVLALALSLLLLGFGCTAADKAQWQEALRDLRGDNMEMGSHLKETP
jgi:hypothetical protein